MKKLLFFILILLGICNFTKAAKTPSADGYVITGTTGNVPHTDGISLYYTNGSQIPASAISALPVTGGTGTNITLAGTTTVTGALTGSGSNGVYIALPQQASVPSAPATGTLLFSGSTGFEWIGVNGFTRSFDAVGLTSNQVYNLPNASGTMVLTSGTVAMSGSAVQAGTALVSGSSTVSGTAAISGTTTDGRVATALQSITGQSGSNVTITTGTISPTLNLITPRFFVDGDSISAGGYVSGTGSAYLPPGYASLVGNNGYNGFSGAGNSWPEQLSVLPGSTGSSGLLDVAVSGRTLQTIESQFWREATLCSPLVSGVPTWFIINAGHNDIAEGLTSGSQTWANYQLVCSWAHALKYKVCATTILPSCNTSASNGLIGGTFDVQTRIFNSLLLSNSSQFDAVVDLFNLPGVNITGSTQISGSWYYTLNNYLSDGTHPNQTGNSYIAQAIYSALVQKTVLSATASQANADNMSKAIMFAPWKQRYYKLSSFTNSGNINTGSGVGTGVIELLSSTASSFTSMSYQNIEGFGSSHGMSGVNGTYGANAFFNWSAPGSISFSFQTSMGTSTMAHNTWYALLGCPSFSSSSFIPAASNACIGLEFTTTSGTTAIRAIAANGTTLFTSGTIATCTDAGIYPSILGTQTNAILVWDGFGNLTVNLNEGTVVANFPAVTTTNESYNSFQFEYEVSTTGTGDAANQGIWFSDIQLNEY